MHETYIPQPTTEERIVMRALELEEQGFQVAVDEAGIPLLDASGDVKHWLPEMPDKAYEN